MEHAVLSTGERKAYEKLAVPFCVFSVHGNSWTLQAVSDGLCRALGTTREALSAPAAEILKKYVHPDDFSHLHDDLENACLTSNGQYSSVYRVRTGKNHSYRWTAGKGCVQYQPDGSYLLSVFFSDVHDETELHREENAEKQRRDLLFSEILSTTQTAIFWKNADRRFLGANRAFLDYYGFADISEIIGKNDEDMGWHTEPDPYKNDELRVLRDGVSTYRVPGKCIARGENRNIVASKSPLTADGKIVGLVGSFEDVTREVEQQQEISHLNAALKEQIRNRDLLMSISEVCIIKISLKDFTLLEYNDAMCRMIGIAPEEYEHQYHRNMEEYFTGRFRGELDNLKIATERAVAAGEPSVSLNMRVPTANGFVWVGGSVSFTDYDPGTKRPDAMYAVYRDITDAIEAQKKLELAEIEIQKSILMKSQLSKMRSMIDGVPAGIGALRIADGIPDKVIQLNRFFTERIDIAAGKDSVVNLDAFMGVLHPDDRERFEKEYHEFMHVKTLTIRQYRFRNISGDYIWFNVRGTVARISEDTEIAYFTYTNINEIKVAEAELKESRRFYRAVVQAAKLATWEYDFRSRTIRLSDDARTKKVSSILAMDSVTENVPDSMAGLIDPDDLPAFMEMYRKVEQGQNASCEVWYKPMNGREPRCERITYIAVNGPDGKPGSCDRFFPEHHGREESGGTLSA
jgi:PAS domain S-box-containing protein